MKILIDMGHPGHVHLFKNFIWEMKKRGHEIKVTARDKEITLHLLSTYNFPFTKIGTQKAGMFNLIQEWIARDIGIFRISRNFHPDILLGVGNPSIAHVAKVIRKPSIIFTDTEHATFGNSITFPFASSICTPSCYRDNIGLKQIRYNGYHELAYLHPNHFIPDSTVLDELGLTKDDHFIIVRFVSWGASHDVGQHGIIDKIGLVKALEQYGRIIITSEETLPEELKKYQISVSPEKLHDLLYYATMYIGEGSTTASECAVLGTHAIYVNTLRLGYTDEEEEKYNLLYTFSNPDKMGTEVFEKAKELLEDPNLRVKGKKKREQVLKEKIDVTAFMVWFIENYPESIKQLKENPDFQKKF